VSRSFLSLFTTFHLLGWLSSISNVFYDTPYTFALFHRFGDYCRLSQGNDVPLLYLLLCLELYWVGCVLVKIFGFPAANVETISSRLR
jgi:hypothetical protein